MPGFDQTGPDGKGSMSGRRKGRCTNYGANLKKKSPSSDEDKKEISPDNPPGQRSGLGRGRGGRGRGLGRK